MTTIGLRLTEDALLTLLIEECAEVIHVACKIQRFGYHACHPDDLATTNRTLLEVELGHVASVLRQLTGTGDVSMSEIKNHADRKMMDNRERIGTNNIERREYDKEKE